jgi:hypothetical protein
MDFKWYFIMMTVVAALIFGGIGVSEWRKMDCRLSLGQAGRPVAEITEICK